MGGRLDSERRPKGRGKFAELQHEAWALRSCFLLVRSSTTAEALVSAEGAPTNELSGHVHLHLPRIWAPRSPTVSIGRSGLRGVRGNTGTAAKRLLAPAVSSSSRYVNSES